MPSIVSRHVTTGQVTTGVTVAHNLAASGTASTGLYGLTEFKFLDVADLSSIITSFDQDMGGSMLQGLSTMAVGIANDMSKYHIKTMCTSRASNTTGTTVTLEFMRFKTLKNLTSNGTIGGPFPPQRLSGIQPGGMQPGGSPLYFAQNEYNVSGPIGPTYAQGGNVAHLDTHFWQQPVFKRFYKLIGRSAVTLSHGQSVEFKWKLPAVSISRFELAEYPATGDYIADKTFFTVWRVRGALGAVTATANTSASTSISTCVMATDRKYFVRHTPIFGDRVRKHIIGDWPQSGTQVFINNEFGTGAVLAAATTA